VTLNTSTNFTHPTTFVQHKICSKPSLPRPLIFDKNSDRLPAAKIKHFAADRIPATI